jgi:hypothetical protein
MSATDERPREGWGVIRPGDRKAHYYRDMTSLCQRIGFYTGPVDEDTGQSSRDDCAKCARLRAAERESDRTRTPTKESTTP